MQEHILWKYINYMSEHKRGNFSNLHDDSILCSLLSTEWVCFSTTKLHNCPKIHGNLLTYQFSGYHSFLAVVKFQTPCHFANLIRHWCLSFAYRRLLFSLYSLFRYSRRLLLSSRILLEGDARRPRRSTCPGLRLRLLEYRLEGRSRSESWYRLCREPLSKTMPYPSDWRESGFGSAALYCRFFSR